MNLITRTVCPQYRVVFRSLSSNAFDSKCRKNADRFGITAQHPTAHYNRYQCNASTLLHGSASPQIQFIRSCSIISSEGSRILSELKKMIGEQMQSDSDLLLVGFHLYEDVCNNIDYPKFFRQFEMEDSFYSWYLVTSIHAWMLMVRAMAEGERGKTLRSYILQVLWIDVQKRGLNIRTEKRYELYSQFVDLADEFQYTIIAYDEGLASDAKLASAIWAQFFDKECDDLEQIELLVKYVRVNIAMLDRMTSEQLLLPQKMQWTALNDS